MKSLGVEIVFRLIFYKLKISFFQPWLELAILSPLGWQLIYQRLLPSQFKWQQGRVQPLHFLENFRVAQSIYKCGRENFL